MVLLERFSAVVSDVHVCACLMGFKVRLDSKKSIQWLKALDHYINTRLLLFLNIGCGWAGYVILCIQKNE